MWRCSDTQNSISNQPLETRDDDDADDDDNSDEEEWMKLMVSLEHRSTNLQQFASFGRQNKQNLKHPCILCLFRVNCMNLTL